MTNTTKVEIELETFQSLRDAVSDARGWMAHNACGNDWANRVREQLNKAVAQCDGVASNLKFI